MAMLQLHLRDQQFYCLKGAIYVRVLTVLLDTRLVVHIQIYYRILYQIIIIVNMRFASLHCNECHLSLNPFFAVYRGLLIQNN